MQLPILLTVFLYMLSAAAYFAYLFYQKRVLHRTGFYMILAGFVLHTMHIGSQWFADGHFPARNLHETLSLAGWATAGFFLSFQYRYRLRVLGIYAAPLVALVMVAVSLVPDRPTEAQTIFKSFWLISHVITMFVANAGFALACGLGILYILQENGIKNKNPGFFFKRLPSLEILDATGYTCIIIGFVSLTFGLITGFVYAKTVWGRFWSWDPKEVWSGITWLFYAALLHERLMVGWRGRRAAIMAIIGFLILLFTFLGVNFLLEGHHQPFVTF